MRDRERPPKAGRYFAERYDPMGMMTGNPDGDLFAVLWYFITLPFKVVFRMGRLLVRAINRR